MVRPGCGSSYSNITIFRHEHLYESMTEKLIRSDEFPKNKVGMARLLLDSKVILCTLSMILNPALFNNNTFDIVPPRCLLIDEASQISVFEFMVRSLISSLSVPNPFPQPSPFLMDCKNISRKYASLEIHANVLPFFL